MGNDNVVLLPEFIEVANMLEKSDVCVLVLAILDFAKAGDSSPAQRIMPPYLYRVYEWYIDVLKGYYMKEGYAWPGRR